MSSWLWGPTVASKRGTSEEDENPILPTGRVHLIGGSSGSGKTTFLFQLLKAAFDRQPFLERETRWLKTAYIAFDRREDEQEETMRRVGLDPAVLPHKYQKVILPDKTKPVDNRFEDTVKEALRAVPGLQALILDGFFILAPFGQINDYMLMSEWFQRVGDYALAADLCLIGVCHSAKQREGNRIIDPRYSITGSVASGGYSSTNIVIEAPQALTDPERRVLHIHPRNSKSRILDMKLDDHGLLQPYADMAGASLP